jgi:hypothetical protein
MDRLKAFLAGAGDIAKIFGVVAGLLGLIGGGIHFAVWLSNRADAKEVAAKFMTIGARQDVVEVRQENETEWRRAIWEQTKSIADKVGAKLVPPPVISTVPTTNKEHP